MPFTTTSTLELHSFILFLGKFILINEKEENTSGQPWNIDFLEK